MFTMPRRQATEVIRPLLFGNSHRRVGSSTKKALTFGQCFFSLNLLALLLFQQAGEVSHHQVTVDFLNQVKCNADRNQKSGASIETGDHIINT